jgi:Carboxypeptidase regulatory-like domain
MNKPWRPRRRTAPAGRAMVLLLLFGSALGAEAQQSAGPPAGSSIPIPTQPTAPVQTGTQPPSRPAPASIHGTVVGSEGAVYEGVHITLAETSAVGAALPARTEATDSDGEFTFTGVPAGSFTLTVASEGFVTKTITGELAAGQSYDAHEIVLAVAEATTDVKVSARSSTMELARQQLHFEEQQRVLGVIPNFYVTYDHDAAPLNTKQKYELAWKSNIDPFTWVITGAFAGIEQADDTFPGYGQGAQGYAKRYGANFADNFIATEIGGAILPSLFRQDPRYFYKGTGTVRTRVLYALANAVMCKGDNGRWQFNYSGILGSMAAGGISNLYYPASDRDGASLTFENAAIGIAGSAVSNLFQEFVVKKLTPAARKNPAAP